MMELNANKLAAAAAITTALLWIACSLLVVSSPGMSMQASGHMMHMDLTGANWSMTAAGFALGLVLWMVTAAVSAWVLATVYNRLL